MKKKESIISPPLVFFLLYIFIILFIIFCLKTFTFISAPLFVSFGFAYLFNPLINLIERKTPLTRPQISAFLMIFLVLLTSTLIVIFLPEFIIRLENAAEKIPVILKQFTDRLELISNYLNKIFSQFIGKIDIADKIGENLRNNLNNLSQLLSNPFSTFSGLLTILVFPILIPLFTYYFIKDYKTIKKAVFNLVPSHLNHQIGDKVKKLNVIISSFIRGQAIVVLILIILYTIGLSIIRFPFPFLVGIFSGLGDLIPYFGTITGCIISLIIGIAYYDSYQKLLLIILVFTIVKTTENYFFYPKIVGKKIGLHFVWIIITIFVFGKLFGFWGLVVAIPSTAGFKMILSDLILYYRKTK